MILTGYFSENNYSGHTEVRQKTLNTADLKTTVVLAQDLESASLATITDSVKDGLLRDGFAFFRLPSTLDDKNYLDLSNALGIVMPEDPEEISQFVRHGAILEVKERFNKEASTDMQPFSRDAILVHTENSRSLLTDQPRYIAFQCISHKGADSPTLLMPMTEISEMLTSRQKAILMYTSYQGLEQQVPILREEEYGPVFSFRDFGSSELLWSYTGEMNIEDDEINEAVEALLTSIYSTRLLQVEWKPSTLFIFDNFRFFHAKPESLTTDPNLDRHLDRIRIGERGCTCQ